MLQELVQGNLVVVVSRPRPHTAQLRVRRANLALLLQCSAELQNFATAGAQRAGTTGTCNQRSVFIFILTSTHLLVDGAPPRSSTSSSSATLVTCAALAFFLASGSAEGGLPRSFRFAGPAIYFLGAKRVTPKKNTKKLRLIFTTRLRGLSSVAVVVLVSILAVLA